MTSSLSRIKALCLHNPARFNWEVLGRPKYWARQAEICRSVATTRTTLVQSGNAIGKSYALSGLILWYLFNHRDSLVVATAPTQVQLEKVLWKQVERAYNGSRRPLGGRMLREPLSIDLGGGWEALAYSTRVTERFSGHHRGDLLAVIDEGSGVEPAIWEAFDSLNPSRMVVAGNPLRPDGPFYERCTRARHRIVEGRPDPLTNWIKISSLESPDRWLSRSGRGLADATWLEKARDDWGEDSAWWKSHVLGEFPDAAEDSLIPRDWLDRCNGRHVPAGHRRMHLDVAGGTGRDKSVILARDDGGILYLEASPAWTFEQFAARAAAVATRLDVAPHRVTYDSVGIGFDFKNRLATVGLAAATAYNGAGSGGPKFTNLRGASAWCLRRRLDPNRVINGRPQSPFSIRSEWLAALRPELQAYRYTLATGNRTQVTPKADIALALGHSPDLSDALIGTFSHPEM